MKITKDTKIGELIPEHFELCFNEKSAPVFNQTMKDIEYIRIPIKKKQEKNFEWYIHNYLDVELSMKKINGIYQRVDMEIVDSWIDCLIQSEYTSVPFEVKIGLLDFIHDDLNLNFYAAIGRRYSSGSWYKEIESICPKEFLESIFE